MIVVAIALLLGGLALSAFFSGSETGFYRVTRVRFVIDAVDGDWISRVLLQLTNHPAVFVATTLIGNNIANYTVSLGVVLLTRELVETQADVAELAATVLFSPLVFVYGELLPKYLFYNAPNLLLRRSAPLFLLFVVLFAPVSALLALLGRGLQSLVGETPLRVHPALARKELQEVLREGQEVGILQPFQRRTAQNLFEIGGTPALRFCRPPAKILSVPRGTGGEQIVNLAQRRGEAIIALTDPDSHAWTGYLRLVDLRLDSSQAVDQGHPLIRVSQTDSLIHTLIRLQSTRTELAVVVDDQDRPLGLLYASDVTDLLVGNRTGGLASAVGRHGPVRLGNR